MNAPALSLTIPSVTRPERTSRSRMFAFGSGPLKAVSVRPWIAADVTPAVCGVTTGAIDCQGLDAVDRCAATPVALTATIPKPTIKTAGRIVILVMYRPKFGDTEAVVITTLYDTNDYYSS